MRAGVVLLTLLSHWRRRPFQLVTLMIGLAVATALWSGVQALNQQARESYDAAAGMLGASDRATLSAPVGSDVLQSDYIALRRAGWPVTPVIEGDVTVGGASYRLVGIDIVTMAPESRIAGIGADGESDVDPVAVLTPPSVALADGATVEALGGEGARPQSGQDKQLPPLAAASGIAPQTLVTDIGVAQSLLDRQGLLSHLIVTASIEDDLPALEAVTQGRLQLREPSGGSDLQRLTDSFHLNLTAFGLLAFLVGLFIVHSAIGLAFEQRRPMLRTMRACGVSARALTVVMIFELTALAAVAGLVGVVAGYLIASTLLPDVAASLRGLYGARIAGELELRPVWWLSGIAISVIGALAAAGRGLLRAWRLPLFATAQPEAWATAERRTLKRQALAASALALAALLILVFGNGLVAGFALMGAMLLAAALLLPAILAGLLRLAGKRARRPVTEWFFADARQELGGLSLALMALFLALAVNVGVGTMVSSFRLTFTGWLDQRLAAEIYADAENAAEARGLQSWLESRDDVSAVLPLAEAETRIQDFPVELYGYTDHPTYRDNWPLIASNPDVWERAADGEAILVSEQLARRFDLAPGDTLTIPAATGDWMVEIGAVYTDYGNPRGQVMLTAQALADHFPGVTPLEFTVRAEPDSVPALLTDLRRDFAGTGIEAVDQASIKRVSQSIFERTFAVTLALNTLTLIVAGIALLASLLTLSASRLPRLAPLWALGLTRRRLAVLELWKAIALSALTAVCALPLGLGTAWVLMNVINVEAFGWRLPVHVFPLDWLRLFALALLTALVSAAWPALALRRTPPATLLKVFADAR